MPWFNPLSNHELPTPDRVQRLILGLFTTCLATVGGTPWAAAVFGQASPPSATVDLNATPTVVNGRISRPTLQAGSQGESVIELQSLLMLLGYYSGPLSGVYQSNTRAAVQKFQSDAGINPDGIVGPATWSSLFPAPPSEANPPGTTELSTSQPDLSTQNTPTPTVSPATESATAPASVPSTSTSEPETPDTTERPLLRRGDRGEAVRRLQESLRTQGFYEGPIDGIFGAQTESAVRQAQNDSGLTIDGIVGPATWNVLK
jgi:peptidoglycan hydrolase-like protein with peptidoglycan-binding domain